VRGSVLSARRRGLNGEQKSSARQEGEPAAVRDLLVTGGVDVIDFSKPTRLKEIAYYDPARNSGTWSAYPYAGSLFAVGGPSFDQT
jgi:hypothetical protein